ncbi:unnamed protein product [Macrosiphum euphorbiae]|uniref:Secreted protein n=1 Tax=Macrosiphum euphorbiae TaxID=13131 RepID=A0AAV0Y7I2_9HEMI|nr:unnamed protein product [Macrosiphum euphorbiae]CAI6376911.1 unnamed protein product [Macrosiphum euphorbiae]
MYGICLISSVTALSTLIRNLMSSFQLFFSSITTHCPTNFCMNLDLARVLFVEQAIFEFRIRDSEVQGINQFLRVTAANIHNIYQCCRQVQDCGSGGIRGTSGHSISRVGGRVGRLTTMSRLMSRCCFRSLVIIMIFKCPIRRFKHVRNCSNDRCPRLSK